MHVCDICNYKGKMKRFEAVDCNENLSDKVYTYFSCPDCGTMRLASPLGGGEWNMPQIMARSFILKRNQ